MRKTLFSGYLKKNADKKGNRTINREEGNSRRKNETKSLWRIFEPGQKPDIGPLGARINK